MPTPYVPQNTDGTAHITYFDARTQASFVWDGDATEIQVSIGGYGEPVNHELRTPDELFECTDAISMLTDFENICADHAEGLPNYEDR